MSPNQRLCLKALDVEPGCGIYMRAIAGLTGLSHHAVRCAVRSLARQGYAELVRGLINERTGMIAGSGYGLTALGRALLRDDHPPG